MINQKFKETVDHIRQYGISGSYQTFRDLYKYVLSNVSELKQIKLYQLTGTIFSIIAYEKIPGLSRIPNIAYYCLTQGALVMQPIADFNICIENQNHSIEERVKLLLNGGLKMVIDRVYVIADMPAQKAVDIAILGDILKLKSIGFSCQDEWWRNACEDCNWIRNKYNDMSEIDIMLACREIHQRIAEQVYLDLEQYSKDFGYSK